jgi:ATP-dependent Zn protease
MLTLSGAITPTTSGTIILSQSVNGSAFQQITTVNLTNGAYSYQYTISGAGTYVFHASFAGNGELNPAQSSAVTVNAVNAITTTPATTNYTWYIIGAVIVIIIIIILIAYLMMRRKNK